MPTGACASEADCAQLIATLTAQIECGDSRCTRDGACVEGAPVSSASINVCVRNAQGRCPGGSMCDAASTCALTATTVAPTPTPVGPVCGDGTVESGEQCDGQPFPACCDPVTCRIRARFQVCRPAAGVCDVAEQCSGSSPNCPPDLFMSSNTICRQSGGECDLTEYCTGNAAACPTDRATIQNVCRPSIGICDVDDVCSGQRTCGLNRVLSPALGMVCRPSTGQCDVAETCSGTDVCPPNAFRPIGSACDDGNNCTMPDTCGAGGICGGPNVCMCRRATDCDDKNACTVDSCEGSEAVPGKCTYTPAASGVVCRPAESMCDVAEVCDGSSQRCPVDGVAQASVVCRPSVGMCDVAERCSGTSPACPMDSFLPATTACRPAVALCDAAEMCSGGSAECPPDTLVERGEVCRAAKSECDVVERCDGLSTQCPPDVFALNGGSCRAKQPSCDGGSQCVAGLCSTKSTCTCSRNQDCDDSNPCTLDECTNTRCTYRKRDQGTPCDDGNLCTVQDSCTAEAFCVGSMSVCPNSCSLHGECCAGVCRCDASRSGQYCELFANGSIAGVPGTGTVSSGLTMMTGTDDAVIGGEPPSDVDVGAIVGGVIGALIGVCLLALLVVFGLRMWNNRQTEAKQRKALVAKYDLETPRAADGTPLQDLDGTGAVGRMIPRTHQYHSSPSPTAVTPASSAVFVHYGAMPPFKDAESEAKRTQSSHYKDFELPQGDGYDLMPTVNTDGPPCPPRPLVFANSAADGELTASLPESLESDPTASLRQIGDSTQYRTIQIAPETVTDFTDYTSAVERPIPVSRGYMRRPLPPAQRPANWVPRKFVAAKATPVPIENNNHIAAVGQNTPTRKPMPPLPVARP